MSRETSSSEGAKLLEERAVGRRILQRRGSLSPDARAILPPSPDAPAVGLCLEPAAMLNFCNRPAKLPSPQDIHRAAAGYPNMSAEAGRKIRELVKQQRARYVLELGLNRGHLIMIDLASHAGHAYSERGLGEALLAATDRFAGSS